jgi:hypothetical protein
MMGSPDSRGAYHKEVDTLHKLFPQKPKVVKHQTPFIYSCKDAILLLYSIRISL